MTSRAIAAGLERMSTTALTKKPVLLDDAEIGTAASKFGACAVLRVAGFGWLVREIDRHLVESPRAFHVTRVLLVTPQTTAIGV